MKQNGWRKPTPGLGVAEKLAQVGEQSAVSKSEAMVACKRVGAHIGLKAADMMLLDTFGAFTQPQDWGQGRRPIVWASNATLMAQTGFSLSALKRHARRLIEAGVLGVVDSPNGKRWGHRDARGYITEAYGFDLSPLAARVAEFNDLYAQVQAERQQCARLKRQITILRRAIRAQIDYALDTALPGPWARMATVFETLLQRLPKRAVDRSILEDLLSRFSTVKSRIEQLLSQQHEKAQQRQNTHEMDPKQAKNDPHIQTTNKLESLKGNHPENTNAPEAGPRNTLTLAKVMQACPEFTTWAKNICGFLRDWDDLHRVIGQLGPMIGVSQDIWALAIQRLGVKQASVAMVLIFDKHCAGEVASAAGYLRGMIRKAGEGALHLERSFYGRLKAQDA